MATMLSEVYDALLSAGADETKARKAAEAVSVYSNESRFGKIEADLTLLKWMIGTLGAGMATGFGIIIALLLRYVVK